MSDDNSVPNHRWYRKAEAKLRHAQHKVARRKKGLDRRRKAVQLLQKVRQRLKNQRHEFQHKFGTIAVEDSDVKGLAGGMLAKSIHDASWTAFFDKLAYRAENAGRTLKVVNPRGTSQTCTCDQQAIRKRCKRALYPKFLPHFCSVVSAQVILQRG